MRAGRIAVQPPRAHKPRSLIGGRRALDIGASRGEWAVPWTCAAGPDRVRAFEPQRYRRALAATLRINNSKPGEHCRSRRSDASAPKDLRCRTHLERVRYRPGRLGAPAPARPRRRSTALLSTGPRRGGLDRGRSVIDRCRRARNVGARRRGATDLRVISDDPVSEERARERGRPCGMHVTARRRVRYHRRTARSRARAGVREYYAAGAETCLPARSTIFSSCLLSAQARPESRDGG